LRRRVELAADDLLAGSPAKVPSLRDGAGRTVISTDLSAAREREGAKVELTIDQGLQLATERALARACLGARAAGGMAVALDPRSGEVLHNPNAPRKANELRNRVVADAFEAGSTMKTFVIAGALDRRAVAPLDAIDCGNGRLAIGAHVIHDDRLAGSPAKVPSLRDGAGRTVISTDLSASREREGAKVELTIDQGLQLATERALARACLGARAAGGMAVALAPRSGEVL